MELFTSRPRVLGWLRSAAILDGDWGTSVAYVLGIAFFHAGYFSGWHLMMMLAFTIMIALNYVTICRLYPSGGGVYSSVRHRSRSLAVVGALMLSADYVVTASLSVLDGCHYLALGNPVVWAIAILFGIGALNWFGPRHAGSFAMIISTATLAGLALLVAYAFPTASKSISVSPDPGGFLTNWSFFVAIILSISGIESISNMTGVMKDPTRSSKLAILTVLTKISIVTVVLGLAMNAVPGLSRTEHQEDMIRFLGDFYVGNWFGPIIGFALGFLLISAGNTAINALTSIQFLMSLDGELPIQLRKLNKFGVPVYPLLISTALPVIVLVLVNDVITLSSLYAIGVVGAILINVGSTGTDRSLKLPLFTRAFMLLSTLILLLVETTIIVEKSKALLFALSVLFIGLGAREIARRRKVVTAPPIAAPAAAIPSLALQQPPSFTSRMMVAVRGGGQRLLRQACEDAKLKNAFLFVLSIKEIAVTGSLPEHIAAENFVNNSWMGDICKEYGIGFKVVSVLSNEVGYTIAEHAATLAVDRLILGATQRSLVDKALRGDVIRKVSELLPEEIQLLIYRS